MTSNSQIRAVLRGVPAEGSEPDEVDPGVAKAVLADHREDVFIPVVDAHRGEPFDGPSLSAAFDTAVDAVACALAIQGRTAEWNDGLPESYRPSFHWTVVRDDESPDAVLPCKPGGLAVSAAIDAEVKATDRPPPQRDRNETAPSPSDATVFAPASTAVANPRVGTAAGSPGPGVQSSDLQPGGLLNGTYEIEMLLASGGMGEVFKGREVHSGGEVAVKVIRLDMVHHPSALSLFQKEALVLRDINHDAIVRYYSFSFDPGLRRYYLVMEFVDGPPLSRVSEGCPMSAEAVALLARRVASGLQLAHERGIVHRDLSPDNIILPHGDPGRAKIIDFGIARAAQIGGGTIVNGGFAGKYSYVSPEHLGLAGGEVTAKSDIYSLGIVLAEACLGRPLDMAGTHVDVIEKRRRVPDLSGVDTRLRGLIARMLDPDPERRPESMAVVAEAARLPADLSVPIARPAGAVPEPFTPKPPRRVERWIIGGALVSALALGAGLFGYAQLSAPPPVPQAHLQPRLQSPQQPEGPTAVELAAAGASPGLGPRPPTEAPQPVKLEPALGATGSAVPGPSMVSAPPSPSMTDYVRSYDGGSCFFLRPIRLTPTSAALEAFAQSKDAFTDLDRAFQSRFNISPDIVGSRVWSRQCPALDFMRQATQGGSAAPQLFVKSARVARGQPLAGEIRGIDGRAVALLVVGENGSVRNVTGALKPDGNVMTFELTPTPEAAGPAPEMLLAVACAKPLPRLSGEEPTSADAAFRALLDSAAREGAPLAADAKLFIVGG